MDPGISAGESVSGVNVSDREQIQGEDTERCGIPGWRRTSQPPTSH